MNAVLEFSDGSLFCDRLSKTTNGLGSTGIEALRMDCKIESNIAVCSEILNIAITELGSLVTLVVFEIILKSSMHGPENHRVQEVNAGYNSFN